VDSISIALIAGNSLHHASVRRLRMLQDLLTALIVILVVVFASVAALDFVVGLTSLCVSKPAPAPDEQLFAPTADPESPVIVIVPDPWMLALEEAVVVPNPQTSWSQSQPVLCLPPAREVKEVERKSRPKAKAQPELHKLSSVQLRSVCAAKGIAWRNVAGGKHLTKAQMIERLSA